MHRPTHVEDGVYVFLHFSDAVRWCSDLGPKLRRACALHGRRQAICSLVVGICWELCTWRVNQEHLGVTVTWWCGYPTTPHLTDVGALDQVGVIICLVALYNRGKLLSEHRVLSVTDFEDAPPVIWIDGTVSRNFGVSRVVHTHQ